MSSSGISGSSEEEEFYDALDITPLSSSGSPKNLESISDHVDKDDSSVFLKPLPPSSKPLITVSDEFSDVSLPEEITRELEAISKEDEERSRRLKRLERLRRKDNEASAFEDNVQEEDEEKDTPVRDSTESSVEGIYLSGVRPCHPFKVIEPDTRSIASSDNRSIHGRNERRDRISLENEDRRGSQSLEDFSHRIRTVPDIVKDSTGSTTTGSVSGGSVSTAVLDKAEGVSVLSRPPQRKNANWGEDEQINCASSLTTSPTDKWNPGSPTTTLTTNSYEDDDDDEKSPPSSYPPTYLQLKLVSPTNSYVIPIPTSSPVPDLPDSLVDSPLLRYSFFRWICHKHFSACLCTGLTGLFIFNLALYAYVFYMAHKEGHEF